MKTIATLLLFLLLNSYASGQSSITGVTVVDLITIEINAQNNTSYCAPNGLIVTDVSGGTPPYMYDWSNGATTPDLFNLAAGTYTVTVSDQTGLSETASATITTTVVPMTIEISSSDETAQNANDGTALVEATGGLQPYSYLWSTGETTAFIEDLSPGMYTVTVTDNADCSEIADVVINGYNCPELILESSVENLSCFGICDGSITVVDVINGIAPYSYTWSNGGTDESIVNLCAGTYAVTVYDNNNCIVTGSWTLSEPSVLIANASATSESVSGADDGTANANPVGGTPVYSFLWSNGNTTQQISGLAPGQYSVIVTDVNSCAAYDTVTVLAGPCAQLTATVSNVTCFGACNGSIALDGNWASIQWNTGATSNSIDSLCAGDYSVTVSDNSGCIVQGMYAVDEPDLLTADTGSTPESEQGNDGTAWVTPTGGIAPYTYSWSNGSTDSLITGLVAGIYTVTLTDVNSCSDTAEVEVGGSCLIVAETSGQDASCFNSCDGFLIVQVVDGVGPFQYNWSTGDTTVGIVDLCAGMYSVTITDLGQIECSIFIDFIINRPDSFYFVVDDVVHQSDTSDASINITVNGGTPPYHVMWTGPNQFVSSNEDISGLDPGTYEVTLIDDNDCQIVDTIEILDFTTSLPPLPDNFFSIYPNPASTFIYIETNLNSNYSVGMHSTIGVKIGSWKNARNINLTGLSAGMYVVRIENADGYYVKKVVVE